MLEMGRIIPVRLCESSGSEHSPESSTDLSDLVKSFLEKNSVRAEEDAVAFDKEDRDFEWYDYEEKKDILKQIFDDGDDTVKEKIRREVELAIQVVGGTGDKSLSVFKRLVMSRLRERGFDAGKKNLLLFTVA